MVGLSRGSWHGQEWVLSHPHWLADDNGNTGGSIGMTGYGGKYSEENPPGTCARWTDELLYNPARKFIFFRVSTSFQRTLSALSITTSSGSTLSMEARTSRRGFGSAWIQRCTAIGFAPSSMAPILGDMTLRFRMKCVAMPHFAHACFAKQGAPLLMFFGYLLVARPCT